MLKEHNHQFEVEEVSTNSDSSRHMSSHMSMPMTKNSEAAVVVVPEKRRRFTAQEKVELVRLSYLPGNTVSSVARQYGVSPALLFRWRALDKTGGLVAVETGENTVPASIIVLVPLARYTRICKNKSRFATRYHTFMIKQKSEQAPINIDQPLQVSPLLFLV